MDDKLKKLMREELQTFLQPMVLKEKHVFSTSLCN
jgi:hypothetical protein